MVRVVTRGVVLLWGVFFLNCNNNIFLLLGKTKFKRTRLDLLMNRMVFFVSF